MHKYEFNVTIGAIIPIYASSEEAAWNRLNQIKDGDIIAASTYSNLHEAHIERVDGLVREEEDSFDRYQDEQH